MAFNERQYPKPEREQDRNQFGELPGTGSTYTDEHGDKVTVIDGGGARPAGPKWDPSGRGEATDEKGNLVGGTSAWDETVQAQRGSGLAAQGRAGVTLDQRQADQARGLQMGALGLMGTAARGGAPSRAAVLGQSAIDTSTRDAVSNLASGRGPGAAVAAANSAGSGASTRMAQQNAAATDMRGSEMARNQSEYAAGAGAMRGQDNRAATQNAEFEAQQRALNEAKQQGYENLGMDTRRTQLQSSVDYKRTQDEEERRAAEALKAASDSRSSENWRNGAKIVAAGLSGGMPSDERTKRNVQPVNMGSLAGLGRFMHGVRS